MSSNPAVSLRPVTIGFTLSSVRTVPSEKSALIHCTANTFSRSEPQSVVRVSVSPALRDQLEDGLEYFEFRFGG